MIIALIVAAIVTVWAIALRAENIRIQKANDELWCLVNAVADLGELKAEAYGTVTPHGDGVDEEIRITPETFDAIQAVIQDARKMITGNLAEPIDDVVKKLKGE